MRARVCVLVILRAAHVGRGRVTRVPTGVFPGVTFRRFSNGFYSTESNEHAVNSSRTAFLAFDTPNTLDNEKKTRDVTR